MSEKPFQGSVITLDQIVVSLLVDTPDAFEVRIVAAISLSDHASIEVRLISDDLDRLMKPYALDHLVQKGPGRLCIPLSGQTEIRHPSGCIDGSPTLS